MHQKVLLIALASVYYALGTYALIMFDSGILVSALVLFGIPAYALARFSAAPGAVLIAVMAFGAGIAVLLEGVAHIFGIWYTLGVDELRLFGIIPMEVIFTSIIQTLFLALLYELIFDDGEYTQTSAQSRFISFSAFAASVAALIALRVYVARGIFLSHSYLWLLIILLSSTIMALATQRALTFPFFKRLFYFTAVAAIPLLLSLFVAVMNTQKIFAFANDYLFTFSIFGNMVPLEEVLLMLVLPMFVATFYEIYLDDGKLKVN